MGIIQDLARDELITLVNGNPLQEDTTIIVADGGKSFFIEQENIANLVFRKIVTTRR
jgi:hypothetical protein